MKVYFDPRFKQWCAEEFDGKKVTAVWCDTREEAIKYFNERNKE
jgi:hypothetical protein